MADESHTFGSTRARLEEIVTQVRKKDTSLEKSLDLLEEGVRLANACTELIDQQDWGVVPPRPAAVSDQAPANDSGVVASVDDGIPDGGPVDAAPVGASSELAQHADGEHQSDDGASAGGDTEPFEDSSGAAVALESGGSESDGSDAVQ